MWIFSCLIFALLKIVKDLRWKQNYHIDQSGSIGNGDDVDEENVDEENDDAYAVDDDDVFDLMMMMIRITSCSKREEMVSLVNFQSQLTGVLVSLYGHLEDDNYDY